MLTNIESVDLARLIHKHFQHDSAQAKDAWARLFGNAITTTEFMALVNYGDHTAHCEGHCQLDGLERNGEAVFSDS